MTSPESSIGERIRTPEAKRKYNSDLFTRIADEYDTATHWMSLGGDAGWKRRLVSLLPELRAPRCVDLACGTGDVTFELANRFPQGEVVGVDLTPAMIQVAQKRSTADNVRFEVADMCQTEFPDQWADIVVGSYALRNAPVLSDALTEIRRILKPNGTAAFLDFAKSSNRLLAWIQLFMLKYWGGFWGMVVHGRPEHAYIAASLRQFPNRLELREEFEKEGFEVAKSKSLYLGALELIVLRRR